MPLYRILPGKSFGLHQAGEYVSHEAKDAAPYVGTHLELLTEAEAKAPAGELAHFADMNAEDTILAAKQLTDDQRQELLAWERATKKRVTVIGALE